jgi:hypothetical protein
MRPPLFLAAALTLLATIVRLIAGGGGALLGIGWLIPVFGFWFGRRLRAVGCAPADRRGPLHLLAAGGLGVVVVFVLAKLVLPVTVATFVFVALALPALTVLAFRAWPELANVLLVYALAARLPILVITVVAVRAAWGTHYEQLAPGAPAMGDNERITVLCLAQLCLWVPLTILIGGLAGLLGAGRARP